MPSVESLTRVAEYVKGNSDTGVGSVKISRDLDLSRPFVRLVLKMLTDCGELVRVMEVGPRGNGQRYRYRYNTEWLDDV